MVCIAVKVWTSPSSDQAEALVLLHSLSQSMAQDLFALVAGHVQQVVAGVGHGQVMFTHRGGLDDDSQALHAVDGDAVAACQEHWEHGTDTKRKCNDLKWLKTAVQRL